MDAGRNATPAAIPNGDRLPLSGQSIVSPCLVSPAGQPSIQRHSRYDYDCQRQKRDVHATYSNAPMSGGLPRTTLS